MGGAVLVGSYGATTITNTGLISATGSTSLLTVGFAQASQLGTLSVSNGAVMKLLGSYTAIGTNQIVIPGTIVNTGGTLSLGGAIANSGTITSGPSLIVAGASITGGTVIDAAGISRYGTLQDVAYHGILTVDPTVGLSVTGTSTQLITGTTTLTDLSGTGSATINIGGDQSSVYFTGTQALPFGATIDLSGSQSSLQIDQIDHSTILLDNQSYGGFSHFSLALINGYTNANSLTIGATTVIHDTGKLYDAGIGTFGNITNFGQISGSSASGTISIGYQGTVTNAGTISAGGGEQMIITSRSILSNSGLITATGAGTTLTLTATTASNTGSIAVSNGALLSISASTTWSAGSTVSASTGGTVALIGSYTNTGINQSTALSLINNTGGVVALGGTITNSGTIITNAALVGFAPTVIGGTVIDNSGQFMALGGTLNGVAYHGNITLSSNGPYFGHNYLSMTGTTTISGAATNTPTSITIASSFGALLIDSTAAAGIAAGSSINLTGTYSVLAGTGSTPIALGAVTINLGNKTTLYTQSAAMQLGNQTVVSLAGPGATAALLATSNKPLTNFGLIAASGAKSVLSLIGTSTRHAGLITNAGTIAVSNGATLAVGLGKALLTFSNYGAITVDGAGSVFSLLQANGVINYAASQLTGGTYTISNGGTFQISPTMQINTLSAKLTLNGAGSTVQSVNTHGAITMLDSTLGSISAIGTLQLLGARGFNGHSAITDAGTIDFIGGAFKASALTVVATGLFDGYGRVTTALAADGTVEATGGRLTLAGNVTGHGVLKIDAQSSMELTGATAATLTADFNGRNATLKLDTPSAFAASIAGFSAGDNIDLAGILATSASASGTLLSIVESNATIFVLALASPITGGTFSVASDGSGGSIITAGAGVSQLGFVGSIAAPGSTALTAITPLPHEIGGGVALADSEDGPARAHIYGGARAEPAYHEQILAWHPGGVTHVM